MSIEEKFEKRAKRIGRIKDYSMKSLQEEKEQLEEVLKIESKSDNGIATVTLTLYSDKVNQLNNETRLSYDEFCDALNEMLDEEEDDWNTLRIKDQIDLTRDKILEATMIKHAQEKQGLKLGHINGKEVSYTQDYDEDEKYIGNTIIISLTFMQGISVV